MYEHGSADLWPGFQIKQNPAFMRLRTAQSSTISTS